jgi:hypothetical protein
MVETKRSNTAAETEILKEKSIHVRACRDAGRTATFVGAHSACEVEGPASGLDTGAEAYCFIQRHT